MIEEACHTVRARRLIGIDIVDGLPDFFIGWYSRQGLIHGWSNFHGNKPESFLKISCL